METSEDIVDDSDSSKCSSVPKTKTRFPLLDEAYVQESDLSTSSAASKDIPRLPDIIVDAKDIDKSSYNLESSFEEPFEPFEDSGSEYIPGTDESDEEITSPILKIKKAETVTKICAKSDEDINCTEYKRNNYNTAAVKSEDEGGEKRDR